MPKSPHRTRATRTAVVVVLAALIAAPVVAAAGSPASAAEVEVKVRKSVRYCVYRASAGSPTMEKYCKTREAWIRDDHVDPAPKR